MYRDISVNELVSYLNEKVCKITSLLYKGKPIFNDKMTSKNEMEFSIRHACKLAVRNVFLFTPFYEFL